jgi:hypothetical protein
MVVLVGFTYLNPKTVVQLLNMQCKPNKATFLTTFGFVSLFLSILMPTKAAEIKCELVNLNIFMIQKVILLKHIGILQSG